MAEKQDADRFEEEASLFLKELKLAGCSIDGPYYRSDYGSWAPVWYKGKCAVLRYCGYKWSVGIHHAGDGIPSKSFEDAKETLFQLLRFRES